MTGQIISVDGGFSCNGCGAVVHVNVSSRRSCEDRDWGVRSERDGCGLQVWLHGLHAMTAVEGRCDGAHWQSSVFITRRAFALVTTRMLSDHGCGRDSCSQCDQFARNIDLTDAVAQPTQDSRLVVNSLSATLFTYHPIPSQQTFTELTASKHHHKRPSAARC